MGKQTALVADGGQRFPGRGNGVVDIRLGVGGRDKRGLKLAAGQINAPGEHLPEKAGKELRVTPPGLLVIVHGTVVKEEREHASDALDCVGDPGIESSSLQPL